MYRCILPLLALTLGCAATPSHLPPKADLTCHTVVTARSYTYAREQVAELRTDLPGYRGVVGTHSWRVPVSAEYRVAFAGHTAYLDGHVALEPREHLFLSEGQEVFMYGLSGTVGLLHVEVCK